MKKFFKIIMTAAIMTVCLMSCKKVEPVKPAPFDSSTFSVTGTEWRMEIVYAIVDSFSNPRRTDSVAIATIDLNFNTESTGVLTLYTFDSELRGINYKTPDDDVAYSYTCNYPDIFIYDTPEDGSTELPAETKGIKLTANETRDALVFTNFDEYFRVWIDGGTDMSTYMIDDFLRSIVSAPAFYIKPKK